MKLFRTCIQILAVGTLIAIGLGYGVAAWNDSHAEPNGLRPLSDPDVAPPPVASVAGERIGAPAGEDPEETEPTTKENDSMFPAGNPRPTSTTSSVKKTPSAPSPHPPDAKRETRREAASGPGKLARIPDSPNAVSSRTRRASRHVDPLPMLGDAPETRERILRVLAEMGGNTVKEDDGAYIHTVFVTHWLRFRDDVELYIDAVAGIVHFRSASRTGYYDFGANRRRYEQFRDIYLDH